MDGNVKKKNVYKKKMYTESQIHVSKKYKVGPVRGLFLLSGTGNAVLAPANQIAP